jgi:hypothetical protein
MSWLQFVAQGADANAAALDDVLSPLLYVRFPAQGADLGQAARRRSSSGTASRHLLLRDIDKHAAEIAHFDGHAGDAAVVGRLDFVTPGVVRFVEQEDGRQIASFKLVAVTFPLSKLEKGVDAAALLAKTSNAFDDAVA